MNTAEIIVKRLLADLTDRPGFDSIWTYSIDDGTREDIEAKWLEIVEDTLYTADNIEFVEVR